MNWLASLSKFSMNFVGLILLLSSASATTGRYYSADNDVIIDKSALGLEITIIAGRINCGSLQCPVGTERCVISEQSNDIERKIFTERTCLDHEGNVKAKTSNELSNPSGKLVKRVSTATLLSGVQQCNNCSGLSSILNMDPTNVIIPEHRHPTVHHTTFHHPIIHHPHINHPPIHHPTIHHPTTHHHHFNNENINSDDNEMDEIPMIPPMNIMPEMSFPDEANIGIHSSSGEASQRSTILTPLGIEKIHRTEHIRKAHTRSEHKPNNRHVERTQTHHHTRQSFFDHTSNNGQSDVHFSNMDSLFPDTPHISIHHRRTYDIRPRRVPKRSRFNW